MSEELAARRTAAAAVLADYRAALASAPLTNPPGREWMLRLASVLEDLLAVTGEPPGTADEDTRRLDRIRGLLARFDWEHDDRQLALEAIERIADGDEDQAGEPDDLEPYCAECGSWIGIFFGLDGWQHFRGDPSPGGQRELYDTGHEASPAWCEPPGRGISPADAVTISQALEDGERYRRDRAEAWCTDCRDHPAGACDDHADQLDQADAYAELGRQLRHEESPR